MGWFATAQALKNGTGAYGSVRASLNGESDPPRTLSVALDEIEKEIAVGLFIPDRSSRARLSYWSRLIGRANKRWRRTGGRVCHVCGLDCGEKPMHIMCDPSCR